MQEEIFRLLVKKISNELSYEEEQFIDKLIIEREDVQSEYQRLKIIWEDTGKLYTKSDKTNNLEKVKTKIIILNKARHKTIIKHSLQYAALFIGIFVTIAFILTYKKTITISNNTTKIKTVKLPDMSEIVLDTNAFITYESTLLKEFNREINFYGNGYFNIKKDPENKFAIHTNNFDILVFGTKFNLNTNLNNNRIVLEEGKVLLNNFIFNKEKEIEMKPGEIVEYVEKTNEIIYRKTNPDIYNLWINDKINFDEFSIEELIQVVQLYYGKTIIFEDSLIKNKQIGGSAPTDDLSLILQALELITNSKIRKSNDTIYFEKK